MMAKHTISIYDMCYGDRNGKTYSLELWDEKITDSINYLLLLKALVTEAKVHEVPPIPHEVTFPHVDFGEYFDLSERFKRLNLGEGPDGVTVDDSNKE
jgi:hypothetical protein